jgi:hypothetical protein
MVAALVFEGQFLVMNSQAVQYGRLQIVDVNRVAAHVVVIVVGLAVSYSAANAASGHPDGKAARMVIASVVVFRECSLRINRATELARPHDKRFVEHPPPLQVHDQRGGRLVRFAAQTGDMASQFRLPRLGTQGRQT